MKTTLFWLTAILFAVLTCSQSTGPTSSQPTQVQDPEAAALAKKAEAFLSRDVFDSTLIYSLQAVELAEKKQDWESWGNAHTSRIIAMYYQDRCAETAAGFPELEKKARRHLPAANRFWGAFFNIAGAVYHQTGNYDAALDYGKKEISFFEKSDLQTDLAIALNNVGAYYRSKGDYDRALEYTLWALQVYASMPTSTPGDLAWTHGNLSAIWYRKKDYTRSIAAGEKALSILQNAPDGGKPAEFVVIYNDLANACTLAGEYEKSLDYLQEALRICRASGLESDLATTYHNLGHVYRMTGRYKEAAADLKQAIEQYGAEHQNYGKACRHMGFIAQKEGNLRGALAWQQKALRVLADSFPEQDILANPSPQRVNAYLDFLFALRDKGETLSLLAAKESNPAFLTAALRTYDLAAGLLDSMQAEYHEGSRQFWNQEARPIMESAIGVAMQLYQNTGNQQYLEQAFRYAERSKALLLAEALRESAAKEQAGIPEALLQREKELKIDIAFYKKQIFREQQKSGADAQKILLWQSEILKRRRSYEALLAEFEKSYPQYYEFKYRQSDITLAAVQKALAEDVALVEFFAGDQEIYAFFLDRNNARGYRIPFDGSVTAPLDRLLSGLRDRRRVSEQGRSAAALTQFSKDASALFQRLLAPAGAKMPKQLVLIPDGALAYLPFELLLLPDSAAAAPGFASLPYLLHSTAVRYEYSIALALRPLPRHRSERFFDGYAPAYGADRPAATNRGETNHCREQETADFAPLSNNQAEVGSIAKKLHGRAFLAAEATELQFKKQAQQPRIVHLAMHGFLNDCDPLYSGLVFSTPPAAAAADTLAAEDGFLHAYEIYNLRMNADLAVLSACNTGQGKLTKGEGVISLARAFKYAGCANVLMSLWQADDQSTAQIMQAFYRHLQAGLGKDAAIRQAKLDYLGSNTRNHPFFWGAFVLIGDDQPLRQSHSRWWYAFLLIPLAGAGWWYWRAKRHFGPAAQKKPVYTQRKVVCEKVEAIGLLSA
ncbi:MAG: CHAT domain-containing protein [Saprospirales bacterium]|nr:CHAT domain-containing protein [Saprospirales bacterium]